MIIGEGLTYQGDEEKTIPCEDFSFKGGVRYLSYSQKDIFQALALSSIPFASGSLSVDGVTLTPTGFAGGTAKVIKLDVKNTGSLTLVMFYPGKEEESAKAFRKLASQLWSLKFPVRCEEDKKRKISLLRTIVFDNPISYLLVDLNEPLVQKNRNLWESLLKNYQGCAIFLAENPKRQIIEGGTNDGLAKKPSFHISFWTFLSLTSFLTLFFCAYAEPTEERAPSMLATVLGLALLCLTANLFAGIFLSKRIISKNGQGKPFSFRTANAFANVLGIAIAILTIWIFSKKTGIFSPNVFKGLGLATITLASTILGFGQLIIGRSLEGESHTGKGTIRKEK